jgi:lipoprotein-releasing system permease protein
MPFAWFVALRYLGDAKGQTTLILAGASIGVSVVVFLSALIGGLQVSLIDKTLGSQAHITLRTAREEPRALTSATRERAVARVVQPSSQRLRSIDQWPEIMTQMERLNGVTAISPSVTGAGFAARADARVSIVVRGVDSDRFLSILDLRTRLRSGRFDIAGGNVAVGSTLASDLGVGIGDKLRVTSIENVEDVVTVSGVFALGNEAADKTWLVTSLRHAQSLFALPGGATSLELKVADVFDAERIAQEIHARTGLTADSWMKLNAELLSGLSAQSSSKLMIQVFVVLAVALSIASVLIVSVVHKSRESGILRAVGTPRHRVLAVFLIQGGVLGLLGSLSGSALGALFAKLFESLALGPDGKPKFPVQLDLDLFVGASLLATGVGVLSAVFAARRAARLDPATAIRGG